MGGWGCVGVVGFCIFLTVISLGVLFVFVGKGEHGGEGERYVDYLPGDDDDFEERGGEEFFAGVFA